MLWTQTECYFFLYNSSVAMYFNLIHGLQLTEYKAELIYWFMKREKRIERTPLFLF